MINDGCSVDFDNKIIATHFTIPELVLNFTYDVGGKILVFPLSGHGPGLIILGEYLYLEFIYIYIYFFFLKMKWFVTTLVILKSMSKMAKNTLK